MIRIKRSAVPPPSLAHQKKLKSGEYNGEDVKCQLNDDFHGKCYICEKILTDRHVEHLRPHYDAKFPGLNDRNEVRETEHWNRKFDWHNLFPSCGHCNGLKGTTEHIIDCCRMDPEQVIRQKMSASEVFVSAYDEDDLFAVETAKLIEECFKTKGTKHLDALARTKMLKKAVDFMRKEIDAYKATKNSGGNLSERYNTLRDSVYEEEEFAGFLRTEIRDVLDSCPELAPLVAFEERDETIGVEHDRTEVSV